MRLYKFKELSKKAREVAAREFLVDHECFFKEDENDVCTFLMAYGILWKENEKHEYDRDGILVSNGGMY